MLLFCRSYSFTDRPRRKCKNCTKLATKAQTDLNELKELSAELNNICSRVKAVSKPCTLYLIFFSSTELVSLFLQNANVEIRDVEACTMILKRATQLFNKLKEKIGNSPIAYSPQKLHL